MPSSQLFPQSGGIALVSGAIYSGYQFALIGAVQLKLSKTANGPVYVGLPPVGQSGLTSGLVVTQNSGGSLSSGGLADGMEMNAGDAYSIPKSRLTSGIESIRVIVPAASSGSRMYFEPF